MKVVEKFISINGEGQKAGALAVFIRFKGCNISCSYCDTAWANEDICEYEEMSPGEIADYVKSTGIKLATLTGGEPLLQPEIPELIEALKDAGVEVEIETNGSVDIGPFCNENRPIFTMDYKLPSSGCEQYMLTENFRLLTGADTVKMVCADVGDMERVKEIIEEYDLAGRCEVLLSPVFGKMDPARMVEYMAENKMNDVRMQLQMHKVIWNPDEKGV